MDNSFVSGRPIEADTVLAVVHCAGQQAKTGRLWPSECKFGRVLYEPAASTRGRAVVLNERLRLPEASHHLRLRSTVRLPTPGAHQAVPFGVELSATAPQVDVLLRAASWSMPLKGTSYLVSSRLSSRQPRTFPRGRPAASFWLATQALGGERTLRSTNFDVGCRWVVTMRGHPGAELQRLGRSGPQGVGGRQAEPPLEDVASVSRVLGHPLRACLVAFFCPRGGACVSELVSYLQRAQPTASHHLKALARAGVVRCEQRGTWAWYQVVPETLANLSQQLSALVTTLLPRLERREHRLS